MNTKKLFLIFLLISGEVIILASFLYFGRNLNPKILTLNMIVSTIIYLLLSIDLIFPLVNFNDKSQRTIGAIGIRWFYVFFYLVLAIGAMVIFGTVKHVEPNSQVLIQSILFFMLLMGLYFSMISSEKVHEVYHEERKVLGRLEDMRKATNEVCIRIDKMKNVNQEIISKINSLQEDLRFISPSNNQQAFELETNFLAEMTAVDGCLFDIPLNDEKIIEQIKNCERIYKQRKQIFSD